MLVAPPPAVMPAALAAIDCSAADESTVLVVQQAPARQGATLRLSAASGLWHSNEVPLRCLGDWRTSDPAVTLSRDHASLIVGPDATPGQTVTVSAAIGKRRVGASVRVVGRDEVVLTGFWTQDAVDCGTGAAPTEPVRELHFDDEGGYSVTFTPFESYKDYWGAFAFDAAAGGIAFTWVDGNRPADGLALSGKAAVGPDGKLTLNGVFLGDPAGSGEGRSCRYVFKRQ